MGERIDSATQGRPRVLKMLRMRTKSSIIPHMVEDIYGTTERKVSWRSTYWDNSMAYILPISTELGISSTL